MDKRYTLLPSKMKELKEIEKMMTMDKIMENSKCSHKYKNKIILSSIVKITLHLHINR
jgi:hypothetical protein